MVIRKIVESDLPMVRGIYNHYILHSTATFEEAPISLEEMQVRVKKIEEEGVFLIAEQEGQIQGYAYASNWKSRCAYRATKETSVYLSPERLGKGLGSQLYSALLTHLRNMEVHAVIGGIALPNDRSIGLHEKMGYEKVAHFKEVGYKFERWIDVGYWELIL